jgi:hypothetical protein
MAPAAKIISLADYRRKQEPDDNPPPFRPAAARRPGPLLARSIVADCVADHPRTIDPDSELMRVAFPRTRRAA